MNVLNRYSALSSLWFTAASLVITICLGCKTSPTDSPPQETTTLAGTYVGRGNIGGGLTNVLMEFIESDSADSYTGAIRYRSTITAMEYIQVDSTADTVWFRYFRNNVLHSARGLVEANSIFLHFTEPSDIPDFRLNREINGFNMSGLWTGLITSVYSNEPLPVSFTMDQQGQLFFGTFSAPIPYNADFTFSSGVASGSAFQLTGTVYISPYTVPAYLGGSYFAPDTISGTWQADDNPPYDNGEFYFYRSFN